MTSSMDPNEILQSLLSFAPTSCIENDISVYETLQKFIWGETDEKNISNFNKCPKPSLIATVDFLSIQHYEKKLDVKKLREQQKRNRGKKPLSTIILNRINSLFPAKCSGCFEFYQVPFQDNESHKRKFCHFCGRPSHSCDEILQEKVTIWTCNVCVYSLAAPHTRFLTDSATIPQTPSTPPPQSPSEDPSIQNVLSPASVSSFISGILGQPPHIQERQPNNLPMESANDSDPYSVPLRNPHDSTNTSQSVQQSHSLDLSSTPPPEVEFESLLSLNDTQNTVTSHMDHNQNTESTQSHDTTHSPAVHTSMSVLDSPGTVPNTQTLTEYLVNINPLGSVQPSQNTEQLSPSLDRLENSVTPGSANQNNQPKNVCLFLKKGICRHGITGKKNGECQFSHPSLCPKYYENGSSSTNGCVKGNACNLWHPTFLCRSSVKQKYCGNDSCMYFHQKGCKRSPNYEKRNKAWHSQNYPLPSSSTSNHQSSTGNPNTYHFRNYHRKIHQPLNWYHQPASFPHPRRFPSHLSSLDHLIPLLTKFLQEARH